MIRIPYETALAAMRDGLLPYLPAAEAARFAAIFAGNSADGVASHGMNRYPRYLSDMDAGLCDRTVTGRRWSRALARWRHGTRTSASAR